MAQRAKSSDSDFKAFQMADVNGRADFIHDTHTDDPYDIEPLQVMASSLRTPDLLAKIENGIGGSFSLSYAPSAGYEHTLSRKTRMVDPDMGEWHTTYDANIESQRDARERLIRFECDTCNRLTVKDYPNDPDVLYTYDETSVTNGLGRLTKVSDASGVTHYDKRGRVKKRLEKRIDNPGCPSLLDGRLFEAVRRLKEPHPFWDDPTFSCKPKPRVDTREVWQYSLKPIGRC